ncbi:MAG: hypothetical protein K0S65_1772 [Labilithrix sp.]|nr:hypothetical protein [Labilithrix sp.]
MSNRAFHFVSLSSLLCGLAASACAPVPDGETATILTDKEVTTELVEPANAVGPEGGDPEHAAVSSSDPEDPVPNVLHGTLDFLLRDYVWDEWYASNDVGSPNGYEVSGIEKNDTQVEGVVTFFVESNRIIVKDGVVQARMKHQVDALRISYDYFGCVDGNYDWVENWAGYAETSGLGDTDQVFFWRSRLGFVETVQRDDGGSDFIFGIQSFVTRPRATGQMYYVSRTSAPCREAPQSSSYLITKEHSATFDAISFRFPTTLDDFNFRHEIPAVRVVSGEPRNGTAKTTATEGWIHVRDLHWAPIPDHR